MASPNAPDGGIRPRAGPTAGAHPPDARPLAHWREGFDRRVSRFYERSARYVLRHWLALVNGGMALLLALPFLAPTLMAAGAPAPAGWIYAAYHQLCHQWAFRSFFLFGQQAVYSLPVLRVLVGDGQVYDFVGNPQLGYKVAFCQRDVAIYAALLLAGLAFTPLRGRLQPPPLWLFAVLLLPISIDGFTQLFGWRESDWLLRTVTGTIFGMASAWLIYPQIERSARRAARRAGVH